MSAESPVAILFDSSGNALSVLDGVAIPASTPGLLVMGSDGTNSRYVKVDSSGRPVVVGAGVAGTGAGGVLTVQGDAAGTPMPVSGTVTTTNASVGANGAAAPASSNQVGGTDGTNLQPARMYDLDTGAGTQFNLGVSIRLPGAGGSTDGGTASNPLRTDPTGTTTQPISATALPLPTGAATETTLAGRLADATFTGRINTQGQKAMAASTPVVIASDQSAVSTKEVRSATSTRSDVASSAANVTILALNANRLGAVIFNDSTKTVLIKFGTTASLTDFTDKILTQSSYEVPFGYTGRIDGIWTAANGSARVTELTA